MDGGSESVRMALCKWGRHPSIAPVIMGDGRAACGPPGTKAAILGGSLFPAGAEGGWGRVGRLVEEREGGDEGGEGREERVMVSFPHMRPHPTLTHPPITQKREEE